MKKTPAIIKIVDVKYISGFKLSLRFSDGKINEVDFEPFLKNSLHPDVKKYLDQRQFSRFSVKDGELMWGDFDLIFPLADLYEKTVIGA